MHDTAVHPRPFVSVVLPVFNDAAKLREALTSLQQQNYPADQREVIVVDNGSTDDTIPTAESFHDVIVHKEWRFLGSPYSARNRGIEAAQGDVVVLLDATCIPADETWMTEGINCLLEQEADIVGGDVQFVLGDPPTAGQIHDSLCNIRMKESILERGVAKTANLFIRRSVFEAIGPFPEGLRGGADVLWTRRATRGGKRLVFCESARVRKPARSFRALVKKQWRVARGQPGIWRDAGRNIDLYQDFLVMALPSRPSSLRQKIERHGQPYMHRYLVQLWLVSYSIKLVMLAGRAYELIRRRAFGSNEALPHQAPLSRHLAG